MNQFIEEPQIEQGQEQVSPEVVEKEEKANTDSEIFKVYEDCYTEGRKWILRAKENSFVEWDKGFMLGGRMKVLSDFIRTRLENYSEITQILHSSIVSEKDRNKILDVLVMQTMNEFSAWKAVQVADKQLLVNYPERKLNGQQLNFLNVSSIDPDTDGLVFDWHVIYEVQDNNKTKVTFTVKLNEQMVEGTAKIE